MLEELWWAPGIQLGSTHHKVLNTSSFQCLWDSEAFGSQQPTKLQLEPPLMSRPITTHMHQHLASSSEHDKTHQFTICKHHHTATLMHLLRVKFHESETDLDPSEMLVFLYTRVGTLVSSIFFKL